jgi:sugar/nucleoside kinase (ribokinase family)
MLPDQQGFYASDSTDLFAAIDFGWIGGQYGGWRCGLWWIANFIGRVHDDDLGAAFRHDIEAAGVGFDQPPASSGSPTASSIILVTPDAARSMNTFLGASIEFEAGDLALADAESAKMNLS